MGPGHRPTLPGHSPGGRQLFRLKNAIIVAAAVSALVLVVRFSQIGSQLGGVLSSTTLTLPCLSEQWVVEEGPAGMQIPRPACWDFSGDPADRSCVTGDTRSSALPVLISRYDYQSEESKGSLLLELGTLPESRTDPTWAWNGWEALAFKRVQAGGENKLVTLEYLMFGHDGVVLVETGYDGAFDETALIRTLSQGVEELLERTARMNDSRRSFGVGDTPSDATDFYDWLGRQRLSYFRAVTDDAWSPDAELPGSEEQAPVDEEPPAPGLRASLERETPLRG